MRVITGTARGRKLRELPGLDTRPTTDKVKESIFNIVQFDVEGRRVLDLFAGTGQLGIEALSRGAEKCVFVDQSREAVKVVQENLRITGCLLYTSCWAPTISTSACAADTGRKATWGQSEFLMDRRKWAPL